jgi:hypothetical protein
VPVTIRHAVDVAAPVEATWAAAVDWDAQGDWVLGTRVRSEGQGLGGRIEAFTGLGRVGFLDTMEITVWEPPHRCEVLHTGKVVRGTGVFVVEPRPGGSRFVWEETLELPLGALGRAGWPLVRPLFEAGLRLSLRLFARGVADPFRQSSR